MSLPFEETNMRMTKRHKIRLVLASSALIAICFHSSAFALQASSEDTNKQEEKTEPLSGHEHMHDVPEGQTAEDCLALRNAHSRVMCLAPVFASKLEQISAAEIIEEALQLQGQRKIDDCHHIAHHIGKKLFEAKESVEVAFNECTHSCIDGCFHGVMQAYIPTLETGADEFMAAMPSECHSLADSKETGDKERRYRQCIHGLGHGLVLKYGEETSISSDACVLLPDSWHQDHCLGGVFMEKLHPYSMLSKDQLRKEIPGICSDEEESGGRKLLTMCLDALGEALAFSTGHSMPQSWSLCRQLPIAQQQVCMDAVMKENQSNSRRTEAIK